MMTGTASADAVIMDRMNIVNMSFRGAGSRTFKTISSSDMLLIENINPSIHQKQNPPLRRKASTLEGRAKHLFGQKRDLCLSA